MHADRYALRGTQKAVLLADQAAADLTEPDRQDRARRRGGEGHPRLALPLMGEDGGEQALARDQPLARAQQLAHEAPVAAAAAVAEHRRHGNAGILPDQCPRLRHGAFAGIKLDLQKLEFLSLDLEINVVGDGGVAMMLPGTGIGHRSHSSR